MAPTRRTLNPLPFGDLEPGRFEDSVRQLAYEFKYWRRLEAAGWAGSDDGVDARGYEIVDGTRSSLDPKGKEEGEAVEGASDRLWLIQCKREKKIGPTKLRG